MLSRGLETLSLPREQVLAARAGGLLALLARAPTPSGRGWLWVLVFEECHGRIRTDVNRVTFVLT